MVDSVLLFAGLLSLLVALWLRYIVKTEATKVRASALLWKKSLFYIAPPPRRIQVWYWAAEDWLKSRLKELRTRLRLWFASAKTWWQSSFGKLTSYLSLKQANHKDTIPELGEHISGPVSSILSEGIVLGSSSVGVLNVALREHEFDEHEEALIGQLARSVALSLKLEMLGVPSVQRAKSSVLFEYRGNGSLPTRVYEGDSSNIVFELEKELSAFEDDDWVDSLHIQETRNDLLVRLRQPSFTNDEEFLELELLAAGFLISGDQKQRQSLASSHLRYQWNCHFPNSGKHSFVIVARTVSCAHTLEIGRVEHTIKVAKLDHLTQRQMWALATLAGIVSGALALAEALHRLGLW
jgi:hypothetical protein